MTSLQEDLPSWIEDRIESGTYDMKLTQRHVASVFVHGDRPYYDITKMHAEVGSEVSRDTVGNRMEELHHRDVLAREKINNGDVYWLDREKSQWPIPPDLEDPEPGEMAVSEWKGQPHVQLAAGSVLFAIVGTAIILLGTFQAAGRYELPIGASEVIATGLSLGLLSYLGLFVAGLVWIFDLPDYDEFTWSE